MPRGLLAHRKLSRVQRLIGCAASRSAERFTKSSSLWRALVASLFTSLPSEFSVAQAANAQYIMVHNTLSATADGNNDLTISPVFLQLFNGAKRPCFTSYVNYGAMVDLSTGARSPCVAPVHHIAITPLPTPSDLICYTGGETAAVTSSASALTVTIQSRVGPVFDTATGEVITPGTAQIVISDFE